MRTKRWEALGLSASVCIITPIGSHRKTSANASNLFDEIGCGFSRTDLLAFDECMSLMSNYNNQAFPRTARQRLERGSILAIYIYSCRGVAILRRRSQRKIGKGVTRS